MDYEYFSNELYKIFYNYGLSNWITKVYIEDIATMEEVVDGVTIRYVDRAEIRVGSTHYIVEIVRDKIRIYPR